MTITMKAETRFFLVIAKQASRSSAARQLAFAALLACALMVTLITFGEQLPFCGSGVCCKHIRCSDGSSESGSAGSLSKLHGASDPAPSQPSFASPSLLRQHALAVIVPFRDRFDDLTEFVPHIGRFLNAQGVKHHIYVVNQVDSHRFNRASLANAGFQLSGADGSTDYVAIHDVDLLPLNAAVRYDHPQPPADMVHLSPPGLHPRYAYAAFFGGAVLMTRASYERINGMSNRFWGWGREDDEFRARVAEARLYVDYPANVTSGNRTFRHTHNEARHPRDFKRRESGSGAGWWTAARDNSGLSDVRYWLNRTVSITVDGHAATIHDVTLDCRPDRTPWCDDVVDTVTVASTTFG